MIFSSLIFLYAFLPANLILYFLSKNLTFRNIVLVVFSLFFYAWGERVFIVLLIFSVFINYVYGLLIEKYRGLSLCKLILVAAVITNIGMLGFFKYYNFIAENIGFIFKVHMTESPFGLPIGISFYTFQILSYAVDVYRGQVTAQRSFYKLLLYVSMYHQLIAGPIVRYTDIENEINSRVITAEGMSYGINRFVIGLSKKVLIANAAGKISAIFMNGDLSQLSMLGSWFGIIMYTIQIYFDFSGYSDMAIGLGRMFGFTYKENFNYPYTAVSVTDFWRRWHMSLSSFFKDYVYIPLGGNKRHQLRNLLIVWGLTGFWHGASWNFIVWGLYYGVLLIAEKKLLSVILEKLPSFVRHAYLLVIVIIGWVFFYYTDISQAFGYLKIMLGINHAITNFQFESEFMKNAIFFCISLVCCTPLFKNTALKNNSQCLPLHTVLNAVLIIMCTSSLLSETYNPFLYFRF